uniref:Uncharacterized protein n=1 Tax=Oryza sativa subsp. japonica TaxID=39947 RepID=Q6Z1B1_ORYSJ|nr:hypothetical protein [Oryza sativa Japonica Group]
MPMWSCLWKTARIASIGSSAQSLHLLRLLPPVPAETATGGGAGPLVVEEGEGLGFPESGGARGRLRLALEDDDRQPPRLVRLPWSRRRREAEGEAMAVEMEWRRIRNS